MARIIVGKVEEFRVWNSWDVIIKILRKIFDDFTNWFDFKGVVDGFISNVPGEFKSGT